MVSSRRPCHILLLLLQSRYPPGVYCSNSAVRFSHIGPSHSNLDYANSFDSSLRWEACSISNSLWNRPTKVSRKKKIFFTKNPRPTVKCSLLRRKDRKNETCGLKLGLETSALASSCVYIKCTAHQCARLRPPVYLRSTKKSVSCILSPRRMHASMENP